VTAETASAPEREHVDELEALMPDGASITVAGVECRVRRIRTRELLRLIRIMTEGLGGRLALLDFGSAESDEDLASKVVAALVSAIPYAEDELIGFVQTVVEPRSSDVSDVKLVASELQNPDVGTLVRVLTAVVEQEADEWVRLGKDVAAWWRTSMISARLRDGSSTR